MDNIRAINDNTLKQLGITYQNLVALQDCFDLKVGELLQIEINGDVSIISADKKSGRFQKEVKHHLKQAELRDRDIDFWKTLANWYEDFDRLRSFEKLILHTTARTNLLSPFSGWNDLSSIEKLRRIQQIGEFKRKKEKTFRCQYNRIFGNTYNEPRLLSILERFIIIDDQHKIYDYTETFKIDYIPKENRSSFIGALLGEINIRVKNPPYKCELTRDDFTNILQRQTAAHCTPKSLPLPGTFADQTVPDEMIPELDEKPFVQKINEIECENEVTEAITDYWRTEQTIISFFQDEPSYLNSLDGYRDDLYRTMKAKKKKMLVQVDQSNGDEALKHSKVLFYEIMEMNARNFGTITNNRLFFQHGVIHGIADDTTFRWKLGDSNECQ